MKGELMVLYHGSREKAEYPEIRKAVYNKHFYIWILLHCL